MTSFESTYAEKGRVIDTNETITHASVCFKTFEKYYFVMLEQLLNNEETFFWLYVFLTLGTKFQV